MSTRLLITVARARCPNRSLASGLRRKFSVTPSPNQERNNYLIAGGLVAFVGGIYYYTMNMLWAGNRDLINELDDVDNAFSSEGKDAKLPSNN